MAYPQRIVVNESSTLEKINMYNNVFKNKRVFITGHTGFKGAWLSIYMLHLGAEVMGYSLEPPTNPSLFALTDLNSKIKQCVPADIRDVQLLQQSIADFKPDFVFHLAAQPLVLESYKIPRETFEVNVIGTLALLDAVRTLDKMCVVIVISTDKCYENLSWDYGYREKDRLGGHDPYSASKAAMEIAVASYRLSYFSEQRNIRLATARAGNVIGGGDWAKNRIVPDIIRDLEHSESIAIRVPTAIRPWQHVLEPLSGYMWLAARLAESDWEQYADAWNFGPLMHENYTVADLVSEIVRIWGSGRWEDVSQSNALHEASILKLSIEKSVHRLDWFPTWNFIDAVQHTVHWYRSSDYVTPEINYRLCLRDIQDFEVSACQKGITWSQ